MFIPDPDFTHPGSLISDPGSKTATKKRDEKKFVVIPFFVATNFTEFKIIYYKFGIRDPRSGIRKNPIPDPQHWSVPTKYKNPYWYIQNCSSNTII
jgi:hypothetical protein